MMALPRELFVDTSFYVALVNTDHHFEQAGFQVLLHAGEH
jgi:hypothetical protein